MENNENNVHIDRHITQLRGYTALTPFWDIQEYYYQKNCTVIFVMINNSEFGYSQVSSYQYLHSHLTEVANF